MNKTVSYELKIFGITVLKLSKIIENYSDSYTTTSWFRIRKLIKRKHNATCNYCGKIDNNGHVDHIIPLSKGGTDSIDNLVWSCSACNLSKNNKLPDEWDNGNYQFVSDEDKQRIIDMVQSGKSYRAISQTIWDGRFGSYYNDIINDVLRSEY